MGHDHQIQILWLGFLEIWNSNTTHLLLSFYTTIYLLQVKILDQFFFLQSPKPSKVICELNLSMHIIIFVLLSLTIQSTVSQPLPMQKRTTICIYYFQTMLFRSFFFNWYHDSFAFNSHAFYANKQALNINISDICSKFAKPDQDWTTISASQCSKSILILVPVGNCRWCRRLLPWKATLGAM